MSALIDFEGISPCPCENHWRTHLWSALRYGQWDLRLGFWKGKPKLGVFATYYDGHHGALHLGPICLSVFF